jgi:hypothetical protein
MKFTNKNHLRSDKNFGEVKQYEIHSLGMKDARRIQRYKSRVKDKNKQKSSIKWSVRQKQILVMYIFAKCHEICVIISYRFSLRINNPRRREMMSVD